MTGEKSPADLTNWQQQAYQYLIQEDYREAANLYEQQLEAEPDIRSHYWHLGLLLLLQEQETEAQTTWMLAMAEATPEQVELATTELLQVLQTEAERREALADYSVAWAIRQHIREINPSDINNLLHLLRLSIELDTLTREDFTSLGLIQMLQSGEATGVNPDLMLEVLRSILDYAPHEPLSIEFTEACLSYVHESQALLDVLLSASIKIGYSMKLFALAAHIANLALSLNAKNQEVLRHLATFYQNAGQYDEGIETARLCYSLMQTLPDKIFANHLILRGLMSAGGYWEEAVAAFGQHESLLLSLIKENPLPLDQTPTLRLFTPSFFFPYFKDDPRSNRSIQNGVVQVCQSNVHLYAKEQAEQYHKRSLLNLRNVPTKPLKIGYLSHCLKTHSVGWLARWIFQHHDQQRFEVNAYLVNYQPYINDPLEEKLIEQVNKAHKLGIDGLAIAEQIYQDEIDILIDLDSITLDISCEVMALKPAPVQVTWLGWDASGLPAIDYFIADPYVLPESAQDYYSEKIWRLPQTYIAVDGFEVAVPTLRRDHLDIPNDAVIYFSAQRGFKRHRDTARLQMKILKEVPDSYFLIKGLSDQESIKIFFNQIAEEEGVNSDRLRFLPEVGLESIHRANLGIADVVLDTYPYNGATTTLETLWMGIPLVTRVGEQFAARNSYTMLMNVGVTEGIAWTDEEYVEWGVRLGKEAALRQKIAWRLKQSRQTSPLWNAKQFTREMEKAYEQMWAKYLESR
ncbi:O-linked N-acetylglucosamine transferase, SPINDLY family protein [Funiculus sociatus GB2-A5]|uniref:protein O-GlcNAc transferase n=1 Tax=Funiculus sociatus GB2-A5 TaxID=2933946 RepID=A0ABV0JUC7_9CYAN|nr:MULTISPECIES: O-linked N-acetylglucosamine transferase, SPINDLY family protein [unclassified Trichocoleus]MBD1906962.1 O-linked N-acetylglucosamine transferase, SPINDLY family protein [Trichocoleus sp. FACHB-832]MBD2063358.1 O-linked N-acetylglucosamine transferase, SPINDLY family protein [Trichocoleus sp. FACHB-6]